MVPPSPHAARTASSRRSGSVMRPSGEAEQELAQKIGELSLLGRVERAQDPALVLEVVHDGRVDEIAAGLGQRDQDSAAIVGVALAGDQLRLLEPVEPLGRPTRRQHQRVREVASGAVGRAAPPAAASRGRRTSLAPARDRRRPARASARSRATRREIRPITPIGELSRSGRSRRHCSRSTSTPSSRHGTSLAIRRFVRE